MINENGSTNNTKLSIYELSRCLNFVWHQGQKPLSLIRCRCIRRRTWGKVTPVVFFKASLLGTQETHKPR